MTKPRTDFTVGTILLPVYEGGDAPPRTGEFTALLHAQRGGYFYLMDHSKLGMLKRRLIAPAVLEQMRGVQRVIEEGRLWLARRIA